MRFTVLNVVFMVAYLLSAVVQYNDPDAGPWILMYLLAAGMCALQFRTTKQRLLPRVLLVVSLVWAGALLPEVAGQASLSETFASVRMQTRAVEEAREIGGLLMIALWSGVLGFRRVSP